MGGRARVAVVLHAHLPYPRSAEDRLGEQWFYEALWECYLPLLEVLDRLAADRVPSSLTLSVSPTLAAMFGSPRLRAQFVDYLHALAEVNEAQGRRSRGKRPPAELVALYRERLRAAERRWSELGGDWLGALRRHCETGRLELWTTTVSHAYLPGLRPVQGAVEAQLRLGQRCFRQWAEQPAVGLWLPECAFEPELDWPIRRAGFGYSLVDAHGLEHATARPHARPPGPVIGPSGVAYLGRDRSASLRVWSRSTGYPGDPDYRDFYRDVGQELRPAERPWRTPSALTGLRYHCIGRRGAPGLPYRPEAAARRAAEHARHFVASLRRDAARAPGEAPALVLPAFDAELFGHWWFEGPRFIEQVLRRLAASDELCPTTPGAFLRAHRRWPVAEPSRSSWGEGGYGRAWVGPETALLWRVLHRSHGAVRQTTERHLEATGAQGLALDQAIRELLLLSAADWPFMMHGGRVGDYARERQRHHAEQVWSLLELAAQDRLSDRERAHIDEQCDPDGFLGWLGGRELRALFLG